MATLETVKYLGGTKTEIAEALNNNFTNLNTSKLEANAKAVSAITADSAAKLAAARTISLTGAVTGSVATDLSGNASISTTLSSFDASKITSGVIDIARIPQGALERLTIVADDTARFALTTATVQKGDTVKVTATGKMYFVVDDSKLNAEAGYEVYTAGTATSVPWSGITGKPTALSAFTNDSGYMKTTEADTKYAVSSHGTHVTYEGTAANIKMNGAAAVGILATVARADHIHPVDTSRAALASPALTGTPTAPTAAAGTNTTQLATTAFVKTAVDTAVSSAGIVKKITFTSADARWGTLAGGLYPLTLDTTGKDIILVMRDNSGTVEQCEVGVKVSGNNRILDSYDKFAGYVLCI